MISSSASQTLHFLPRAAIIFLRVAQSILSLPRWFNDDYFERQGDHRANPIANTPVSSVTELESALRFVFRRTLGGGVLGLDGWVDILHRE